VARMAPAGPLPACCAASLEISGTAMSQALRLAAYASPRPTCRGTVANRREHSSAPKQVQPSVARSAPAPHIHPAGRARVREWSSARGRALVAQSADAFRRASRSFGPGPCAAITLRLPLFSNGTPPLGQV